MITSKAEGWNTQTNFFLCSANTERAFSPASAFSLEVVCSLLLFALTMNRALRVPVSVGEVRSALSPRGSCCTARRPPPAHTGGQEATAMLHRAFAAVTEGQTALPIPVRTLT
jgi:hypothetical protein